MRIAPWLRPFRSSSFMRIASRLTKFCMRVSKRQVDGREGGADWAKISCATKKRTKQTTAVMSQYSKLPYTRKYPVSTNMAASFGACTIGRFSSAYL